MEESFGDKDDNGRDTPVNTDDAEAHYNVAHELLRRPLSDRVTFSFE